MFSCLRKYFTSTQRFHTRIASIAIVFSLLQCWSPITAQAAIWQTIVNGNSFNSLNNFTNAWGYNYPWGTDHNGSARMNATNVQVANGIVTLVSSLTNAYEGTSSASPYLTIRYNSGTFYLKQQITVSSVYPIWDISGQFKVPTQTGTWPAFWMTGVNSWPPESDFMEFKGSTGCNQNTYDGSWETHIATVSTAASAWHTYRLVASLLNATNVDFHYYIDGKLQSEQTSSTFVGSPCWLIVDYQMEGSSGNPGSGPAYTTYAYVTNIVVTRLNTAGTTGGLVPNGAYKLLAGNTGDALDVGNQATDNGSTIDQWPYNGGLNQQWLLTNLGGNQYSLMGRQSGRVLQVMNAATNNGADLEIMDFTNGNNQIWTMASPLPGYYSLMNAHSGLVMEVSDNSSSSLALIDQWSAGNTTLPILNAVLNLETNLIVYGLAGVPGATYTWLTASDANLPRQNWLRKAAVISDANGNCAITNLISSGTASQFFQIQLQGSAASNQLWSLGTP